MRGATRCDDVQNDSECEYNAEQRCECGMRCERDKSIARSESTTSRAATNSFLLRSRDLCRVAPSELQVVAPVVCEVSFE
jgi:hypothetical protein